MWINRWDDLSEDELTRLARAESEIGQLPAFCVDEIPNELGIEVERESVRALRKGWRTRPRKLRVPKARDRVDREHRRTSFSQKEEWLIAFTSHFRKDIHRIGDRKKEGAILGAITEISQRPTDSRGNTIKPLSGSHKGKWRYRIGKYRLVYMPDMARHIVYLLLISTRSDVYDY